MCEHEPEARGWGASFPQLAATLSQGLVEQCRRQARQIEDLEAMCASRPVIDQAKGILMALYAIDEEHAFALLARWSQAHNIKVRELAANLVRNTAASRRPSVPFALAEDRATGVRRGNSGASAGRSVG